MKMKISAASLKPIDGRVNQFSVFSGMWSIKMKNKARPRKKSSRRSRSLPDVLLDGLDGRLDELAVIPGTAVATVAMSVAQSPVIERADCRIKLPSEAARFRHRGL
jgi:hypothetical protein